MPSSTNTKFSFTVITNSIVIIILKCVLDVKSDKPRNFFSRDSIGKWNYNINIVRIGTGDIRPWQASHMDAVSQMETICLWILVAVIFRYIEVATLHSHTIGRVYDKSCTGVYFKRLAIDKESIAINNILVVTRRLRHADIRSTIELERQICKTVVI